MQAILLFNGCILLVVGAFLGFPYWRALKNGKESAHAWRVAHSAITAGAVGIIVIASVFHLLKLPPSGQWGLVIGALTSGYGFGIASTLSAVTGHRGLGDDGSCINKVTLFFNILGALGSTAAGPFLLYGSYLNMISQ